MASYIITNMNKKEEIKEAKEDPNFHEMVKAQSGERTKIAVIVIIIFLLAWTFLSVIGVI